MVESNEEVSQKRPLTDEERNITTKQLSLLAEDVMDYAYQAEYHELMVTQGLLVNFRRQMREHQEKMRKALEERDSTQWMINELTKQLNEGVLVKKESLEE